jgi:ActR/RegA family two-component response regulator
MRRILIVDDDDVLCEHLRQKLEARGFEVWSECSGDAGLSSYLYNGQWDYVLSDFRFIPGEEIKTGLDLVKAILKVNPEQKVILQSSEPPEACPCPTLRKPYKLEQLLQQLREFVQPLLF